MKKVPSSVYAIFAVSLLAGGLLSGCTDSSSTAQTSSTSTQDNAQNQDTSSNSATPSTGDNSNAVTPTPSASASDSTSAPTPSGQNPSASPSPASTTATPSANAGSASTSTVSAHTFKDNTYSETASYQAPSGTETPTFKFTLKNDTVTGVELASTAMSPMSQKFQGFFMEGIKPLVIGKKLSDIGTFSRVNGSSLTPTAFNQAVVQLKQDAKA